MTELVTKNYWWLEVIRNVGKYVERYDVSVDEEQNRSTSREAKAE